MKTKTDGTAKTAQALEMECRRALAALELAAEALDMLPEGEGLDIAVGRAGGALAAMGEAFRLRSELAGMRAAAERKDDARRMPGGAQ